MTTSTCERRYPGLQLSSTMLRCVFAAAMLAACASACSRPGQDAAANAAATAAPTASNAPVAPADNACDLLTDAEVRQVFPKAASGKRNTESLQYGLDRCAWKTPTGQIGVEVSREEANTFAKDLRAELQGAVDPRVQGALDRLRFQPVDGIGDHAIAVLEKGDAKLGIYADVALLAIQRNHRMAVLMVHGGSLDVPAKTLDNLQRLGRPLAARL